MGSNYVEFREKGFWTKDPTIELWERLLVLEIDKLSKCPDWLRALRDHWDVQSRGMGSGCNHVGLDDHIKTEEQRQTLVTIVSAALATLDQYGQFIPKAIVEVFPKNEGEGEWIDDTDTANQKVLATYFLKLLKGEYPLTGKEYFRPIEWLPMDLELGRVDHSLFYPD